MLTEKAENQAGRGSNIAFPKNLYDIKLRSTAKNQRSFTRGSSFFHISTSGALRCIAFRRLNEISLLPLLLVASLPLPSLNGENRREKTKESETFVHYIFSGEDPYVCWKVENTKRNV